MSQPLQHSEQCPVWNPVWETLNQCFKECMTEQGVKEKKELINAKCSTWWNIKL